MFTLEPGENRTRVPRSGPKCKYSLSYIPHQIYLLIEIRSTLFSFFNDIGRSLIIVLRERLSLLSNPLVQISNTCVPELLLQEISHSKSNIIIRPHCNMGRIRPQQINLRLRLRKAGWPHG